MDDRIKNVVFNEKEHTYWYQGKELRGVTGAIGKMLRKSFPDTDIVQLATIYGHDVHHESEMWIKKGAEPSTESGKWVVTYLEDFRKKYNDTPSGYRASSPELTQISERGQYHGNTRL